MSIIQKIRGKLYRFNDKIFISRETKALRKRIECRTESNRIYYFCTPTHSNLGDQAQLFCWLRLMKEWYPEYEIVCVSSKFRYPRMLRSIHKTLREKDLIFIHSGYLIFDLQPEMAFMMDVITAFYDRHITILPQTVHLIDDWYKELVERVFNAHPDLTLLCRDEVSFAKAKEFFPNAEHKLFPDVVTSLIGDDNFQYVDSKRNGVLLCVRNDGEKFYTYEQINELRSRFKGHRTALSDTTIRVPMRKWYKHREQLIRKILKTFSQYQVIITDRYHGTIFSQVANTPVIVIDSTDHKLRSGVNWFPKDLFQENVSFEQNLDDAYRRAMSILDRDGRVVKNPPYFKETYYSKKLE